MNLGKLTPQKLQFLKQNLSSFKKNEREAILDALSELEVRQVNRKARTSLLAFAQMVMPEYKIGPHHRKLAELLEDMAHGRKNRTTVSIAPRMGKSQLTSIFFPAWFIGNWPDKKIMMVSHTADLAVDFGRKVRNIVATEEYKQIFPDVTLAVDTRGCCCCCCCCCENQNCGGAPSGGGMDDIKFGCPNGGQVPLA